jgi:23S rRNA (adenine2503-C2)-methyltransferase
MRDLREIGEDELREFLSGMNEKPFRAGQILEWVWKKNEFDFKKMSNLPDELRRSLARNFNISRLEIHTGQISSDGTRKYGFTGGDKNTVEGVLIPSRQRVTACLSSQTGCSLNCHFCATGKLKHGRNLTAGEIYDQVVLLQERSAEAYGRGLSNLVFMGMGEPLLNYDHVLRAIQFITSDRGMGLSPKRITLSTAGLSEGIRRLGREKVRFELAVSLHTANQEKRSMIMPVSRSNPMEELSGAIRYYYSQTGNRVTYEYLLLREFNDSPEDARQLAEFCRITPCKINLIEYNEVPGSPYKKSTPERTRAFAGFLESKNMVVNVRRSRGGDIDAACGQLAGKTRSVD